jgi:hypothetical protein
VHTKRTHDPRGRVVQSRHRRHGRTHACPRRLSMLPAPSWPGRAWPLNQRLRPLASGPALTDEGSKHLRGHSARHASAGFFEVHPLGEGMALMEGREKLDQRRLEALARFRTRRTTCFPRVCSSSGCPRMPWR